MSNIGPYIDAGKVGIVVANHTGVASDSVKAGGYSAWIQAITGDPVIIDKLPDNRVRLSLSGSQQMQLTTWFNSQLSGAIFRKGEVPRIQYDLAPVLKPLALKYSIPVFIGLFIAGYIAGKVL